MTPNMNLSPEVVELAKQLASSKFNSIEAHKLLDEIDQHCEDYRNSIYALARTFTSPIDS